MEEKQHTTKENELLALAKEVAALSDDLTKRYRELKPLINHKDEPHKSIALALTSKSRLSAQAFFLLIEKKLKYDSQLILRSIFENLVNMKYILIQKDKKFWASRYIEYQYVCSLKYLERIPDLPFDSTTKEYIEKLKSKCSDKLLTLKEKYGKNFGGQPKTWSGKTIKEMADECGLILTYNLPYALWSDYHHANISSINLFAKEIEGDLIISEEFDKEVSAELVSFMNIFNEINDLINSLFNLGIESKINELKVRTGILGPISIIDSIRHQS